MNFKIKRKYLGCFVAYNIKKCQLYKLCKDQYWGWAIQAERLFDLH